MNKEALKKAIKGLEIHMVYLHATKTKFFNNFDPLIPNQKLVAQFRIGTKQSELKEVKGGKGVLNRFFRFHVEAGMRYIKGPLTKEVQEDETVLDKLLAAEITATFFAEYAVIKDQEIPKEALQEFGRINAPHHVWPYWREYCQSTCSRMGLPVTVIPMLKIV